MGVTHYVSKFHTLMRHISWKMTLIHARSAAMNASEMEERLHQAFPGCDVAVIDTTGDQYHMEVRIAAPQFTELTRIKQHQAVMAVFHNELKSGSLHALSVKTLQK